MQNYKKIIFGLFGIIFFWHFQVFLSSNTKISGIFMGKPAKSGYVWADAKNTDSRFFWQNTDLVWKEGIFHSDFKLVSGKSENLWNPAPGYVFIDETKGLKTKWKPGQKHPQFMAFADDAEGKFIPATGYKFVYNADSETFADCIWDPNKRYEEQKLISGTEIDTYQCYPGYTFINPGKSLDVAWTPGLVNIDNKQLMAGQKEGSWVVKTKPVIRYRNQRVESDYFGKEFAKRVLRNVF